MEGFSKIHQENKIKKPKIKEGVNFAFEQNPELLQIGTKEQYSEYLDTIFPDSKIKDIVYHGTSDLEDKTLNKKSSFKKYSGLVPDVSKIGFWFSFEKETSELFAKDALKRTSPDFLERKRETYKEFKDRMKSFLEKYKYSEKDTLNLYNDDIKWYSDEPYNIAIKLNIQNPKYFSNNTEIFNELTNSPRSEQGAGGSLIYNRYSTDALIQNKGSLNYDGHDKFTDIEGSQVLVFKPEQIHILGSKQDIKNFKNFIENNKDSQA